MRFVYVCCLAVTSLASCLAAVPVDVSPSDVTVIFDAKGAFSPESLREMERETTQIIEASGIHLNWRARSEAANGTFNDLVVMTFNGSCAFAPAPPLYDEMGPFAFTRTANGEVQPFGEVDCDHVVGSVRAAMFGSDYSKADLLVGRALGRVVAHEIVHMLTKSGQHGHEGVQKASLSGKQLIASSLPLSTFDVDRLRQEHQRR